MSQFRTRARCSRGVWRCGEYGKPDCQSAVIRPRTPDCLIFALRPHADAPARPARTSTVGPTAKAASQSMTSTIGRGVVDGHERNAMPATFGFEFALGGQPRCLNTAALCKAT